MFSDYTEAENFFNLRENLRVRKNKDEEILMNEGFSQRDHELVKKSRILSQMAEHANLLGYQIRKRV